MTKKLTIKLAFKKVNVINTLQAGFVASLVMFSSGASSLTFSLPSKGDVIGKIQKTTARRGESLGMIGRRFDVGVIEMMEANPGVDPWVPGSGTTIIVPTQFILPPGPRKGIVINLAEMRLYYYHPDGQRVSTHPIGVGKKHGWGTPTGQGRILSKTKDPAWHPPASIRREHLAKGDVLPAVVPAGPNNPLGRYAFKLSIPGILLHGSNRPGGIGVRSSHGCIRMFPEDIESMYYSVAVGTSIRIIHEPYKVGWHNNKLYLEAHQPLSEGRFNGSGSITSLQKTIQRSLPGTYTINWSTAKQAAKALNGCPTCID